MGSVRYAGNEYPCMEGESVLQTLTRVGVRIPSSCSAGICQTCMMQAMHGTPSAKSQESLRLPQREQGLFLACVCKVGSGEVLEAALPGAAIRPASRALLVAREALNSDIYRLVWEAEMPAPCRPGQFVNLTRDTDGLTRSYSVASVCFNTLELHVRHLTGGAMSGWLTRELPLGGTCTLQGPNGSCCYTPGNPEQPLIMVGTGSGLAPLYGIARSALDAEHRGPITLYHGSYRSEGLYLTEELQRLSAAHNNFRYVPCADVAQGDTGIQGLQQGRVDLIAAAENPKPAGSKVYLCGHPDMVKSARKKLFLAGVNMADIFADPFVLSPTSAAIC